MHEFLWIHNKTHKTVEKDVCRCCSKAKIITRAENFRMRYP